MPGAERVMGGLNPCSRIFLESCFCQCPSTNFHVDLPETSLVQSPAKQQPTSSTLSDDSDDLLLDLGSPPSYHPNEDGLFSAETNVVPGMLTGWSLSLVTKFFGVSDFHKFHLINQKHHKDEEKFKMFQLPFKECCLCCLV